MAAAVPVIAVALGVGSTAYSIFSSKKARKEQGRAMDGQKRQQEAALAEAEKQKGIESKAIADATARDELATSQKSLKQKQRALASGSAGRQGTILTGALGDAGEVTTTQKTLLGA